ncbi:MAG TPA: hypothetical protein VJU18_15895 [Vicinamibacteria bacterium]|nr:hypothetical protein [Vicinamibacteria bacterium]
MNAHPTSWRALARLRQQIDDAEPRHLRRWTSALVFLALWGLITHGNSAGTGDEPHYLMIAHSLVFDRDFDLANNYADPTNLVADGSLQPERHAIPGRDGILRSVHDVGMPAAFAPCFGAAYFVAEKVTPLLPAGLLRRAKLKPALMLRHLMSFGMMALASLLAALLFDAFLEISGRKALALAWALLIALSPPLLSHSFLFFTEVPSALGGFLLWRALDRAPRSRLWPALYGLLIGALLLIHVRNVGLVAALLVLAAMALRERRDGRGVLLLAGGFALALGLRTWITYTFWGSLLTTPHAAPAAWRGLGATLGEAASRLLALSFDQEHGLLTFGPIHLLLLAGVIVVWREGRGTALRTILPVGAYLVFVALPMTNVHGWRGGWSPAARFLVPIMPWVALLGFRAVAALPRWPLGLRALVAVQCALNAYLWQHPRLLWNNGDGTSELLARFSIGSWKVAEWVPSWETFTPTDAVRVGVLVALWVAGAVAVAHRSRSGGVGAGPA